MLSASTSSPVIQRPDAGLLAAWDRFEVQSRKYRTLLSQLCKIKGGSPRATALERQIEIEMDALRPIENEIIARPATTVEGLLVKARLAVWCRVGVDQFTDQPDAATDSRAMDAVIRDIVALDVAKSAPRLCGTAD